ncbi:hypothetical protein F2Q69_00058968 [Brassica cretica]|uniref:Uncharacterized protein n=1 Tax=Brassica cretica TaxID=69181 RepID=A0A8S9RKH5_BRACR|nr:hypothetical protein F2Q69_00058968 [Brassica cretica]
MIDSLGWMISYEKIHLISDLVVVFAGEIEIGGNSVVVGPGDSYDAFLIQLDCLQEQPSPYEKVVFEAISYLISEHQYCFDGWVLWV